MGAGGGGEWLNISWVFSQNFRVGIFWPVHLLKALLGQMLCTSCVLVTVALAIAVVNFNILVIHKCVLSELQPLNVVSPLCFVPTYCIHCDHSGPSWRSISLHTEADKNTPCGDSKTKNIQ